MPETETKQNSEKEKNTTDGVSTNSSWSQFDELPTLYEDMASWPYRRDIEIPNTLEVIGNAAGLSILDYGCGTGTHSRLLKEAGASRVVAFDPCLRMLESAKKIATTLGTEMEFTAELVPEIYNDQFDLVLGVYVLPYAKTKAELNDMCIRMWNLLKPGGRLITLPIHPDYNLNPDYYAEYGLRLIPQQQSGESYSYIDGGPVELHLCHEIWDIRLMATYWSSNSLSDALLGAGFSSMSQVELRKTKFERCPTLAKYVNQPHASVIECRK